MSRRLRKNERCPIHRSRSCCGREKSKQMPRRIQIKGPVTRIPDEHHPRGYIEVCSPAEKHRRLVRKLEVQNGDCAICHDPIEHFDDAELDHKIVAPAGCKKDDHWDNVQATHRRCNREKGSKRPPPELVEAVEQLKTVFPPHAFPQHLGEPPKDSE